MKLKNIFALAILGSVVLTSCNKDNKRVEDYPYAFNTGQVAAAYAYDGTHANTLSVDLQLEGQKDGTMITVTINNSIAGETYNVHAHDAADAAVTPNMTPYDETPNSGVFAQAIVGTAGAASASQMSTMTVTELTETYEGFLVVHDPLQAVTTTDPTTYVILGSFARK